ncbi:MAG: MFS transporter [Sedimenticola sp.]|nr:MFS transporter [Sedimenticola sp.]
MDRNPSAIQKLLSKSIQVEPGEVPALLWSFSYFFALLCSYYILRPMRDEMGILGGVENLQWLFTGTLLAMIAAIPLFGWVSSRFPRRKFLPYVYLFFIGTMLLFYLLMEERVLAVVVARSFFIWASVFNLFVVSVFWSFMTDIYSNGQARRLFGFIAAGGTVGAITGPAVTALLVEPIGPRNLLLISALFLAWAILSIARLDHWAPKESTPPGRVVTVTEEAAIGGSVWDGIRLVIHSPYLMGIGLLMLLFTTLATFLYLMQAQIIRDALVDSAQRTALFAQIDLTVNTLTLLIQLFLTNRLIKWLKLPMALALIPLLLAIGFILLGFAPTVALLIVVQVIRRAGNYAIMRPAREMLYVVLSREEKYKAKNVIDTLVYRTGDAVSAWVYSGIRALGITLSGVAFIAVPLALLWAWVAYKLGQAQQQRAESPHAE